MFYLIYVASKMIDMETSCSFYFLCDFSLLNAMKTENENESMKLFFNTFILLGRKTNN